MERTNDYEDNEMSQFDFTDVEINKQVFNVYNGENDDLNILSDFSDLMVQYDHQNGLHLKLQSKDKTSKDGKEKSWSKPLSSGKHLTSTKNPWFLKEFMIMCARM